MRRTTLRVGGRLDWGNEGLRPKWVSLLVCFSWVSSITFRLVVKYLVAHLCIDVNLQEIADCIVLCDQLPSFNLQFLKDLSAKVVYGFAASKVHIENVFKISDGAAHILCVNVSGTRSKFVCLEIRRYLHSLLVILTRSLFQDVLPHSFDVFLFR